MPQPLQFRSSEYRPSTPAHGSTPRRKLESAKGEGKSLLAGGGVRSAARSGRQMEKYKPVSSSMSPPAGAGPTDGGEEVEVELGITEQRGHLESSDEAHTDTSAAKSARGVVNPFSRGSTEPAHGRKKGQYIPLMGIPQASMNIVANVAYMKATQEIVQLRALVTDGPAICRFLGFVGGMVLFFSSATQLLWSLLSIKHAWAPLLIYHVLAAALGLSTGLLEARNVLCPLGVRKRTREYIKFLSFLWGRGLFYLVGGLLLAMRYPSVGALIMAGYYFFCLGCLDVVIGLGVRHRLETLRCTLTEDEKVIKEKFDHFDTESTGRIQASDLATLCMELGSRLNHRELESAVLALDTNRHGIEYETFVEWWRARH